MKEICDNKGEEEEEEGKKKKRNFPPPLTLLVAQPFFLLLHFNLKVYFYIKKGCIGASCTWK